MGKNQYGFGLLHSPDHTTFGWRVRNLFKSATLSGSSMHRGARKSPPRSGGCGRRMELDSNL